MTTKKSSVTPKATAQKSPAKKSAARKTAATKAAPAKKTPAKKAPAKKASPKKSAGKSGAVKSASSKARPDRKYSPEASETVEREMHEMHQGKLKSGKDGKTVTNPKQAIAIALSEARRAGKKVPPNPNDRKK